VLVLYTEVLPGQLELVEVGPRDGLQNESTLVPTAVKARYLQRLIAAGLRRVEATSFVHPARVPQMADAELLLQQVDKPSGVELSALVVNDRGIQRAVAAGIDRVNLIVVASDEFSRRNQGMSTTEAIARTHEMAARARDAGLGVTLTIGAAFGCPFEGLVDPDHVLQIVASSLSNAVDEVCLADTIGVASPRLVAYLFGRLRDVTDLRTRAHFHNTRNAGYANAYAAIAAGVTALDASAGGIGGCPFAPAATGNIATEDLVWALARDGIALGIDLDGVMEAAGEIGAALGKPVPALVGRTPPFPSATPPQAVHTA
jgi:hydroxymethylglutaryl-CoA lyase